MRNEWCSEPGMRDCPRAVVGYLSSFHKASSNSKTKSDLNCVASDKRFKSGLSAYLTKESWGLLGVKLRFCTAISMYEHRYDVTFLDHFSDFHLINVNEKPSAPTYLWHSAGCIQIMSWIFLIGCDIADSGTWISSRYRQWCKKINLEKTREEDMYHPRIPPSRKLEPVYHFGCIITVNTGGLSFKTSIAWAFEPQRICKEFGLEAWGWGPTEMDVVPNVVSI